MQIFVYVTTVIDITLLLTWLYVLIYQFIMYLFV